MVEIDASIPHSARLAFRVMDLYHRFGQLICMGVIAVAAIPREGETVETIQQYVNIGESSIARARVASWVITAVAAIGLIELHIVNTRRETSLQKMAGLLDEKQSEIERLKGDAGRFGRLLRDCQQTAVAADETSEAIRKAAVAEERSRILRASEKAIEDARVEHLRIAGELTSRIQSLEADNLRWTKEVASLATGHLCLLAQDLLDFGASRKYADRITLYVFDPNGYLVPVGRYSSDPAFETIRRSRYPVDEGCIGQAWSRGDIFKQDFPDFSDDPEGYLDRCCQDRMDRETARGIRMKSRNIYGRKVLDLSGTQGLGVLIVESTGKQRYKKKTLDDAFSDREIRTLARLTQMLSANVPGLSEAAKEEL